MFQVLVLPRDARKIRSCEKKKSTFQDLSLIHRLENTQRTYRRMKNAHPLRKRSFCLQKRKYIRKNLLDQKKKKKHSETT